MSEKRKIVLDTNCLIASLSRRGQYYLVWKGLQAGEYRIQAQIRLSILSMPIKYRPSNIFFHDEKTISYSYFGIYSIFYIRYAYMASI